MRAYPTEREIEEYNKLTPEEIMAKRKQHKIISIKRGVGDALGTTSEIIKTIGIKGFCVLTTGVGALCLCAGLAAPTTITGIAMLVAGVGAGSLGISELHEENQYEGIIDKMRELKNGINDTYWSIKNTDSYYPLPEEQKGRSK